MRSSRHDCLPHECRCQLCPGCHEWTHAEDAAAIRAIGWLCVDCARNWQMGPRALPDHLQAERRRLTEILHFDPLAGRPEHAAHWADALGRGDLNGAAVVLREIARLRRDEAGPEPTIIRRGAA